MFHGSSILRLTAVQLVNHATRGQLMYTSCLVSLLDILPESRQRVAAPHLNGREADARHKRGKARERGLAAAAHTDQQSVAPASSRARPGRD